MGVGLRNKAVSWMHRVHIRRADQRHGVEDASFTSTLVRHNLRAASVDDPQQGLDQGQDTPIPLK